MGKGRDGTVWRFFVQVPLVPRKFFGNLRDRDRDSVESRDNRPSLDKAQLDSLISLILAQEGGNDAIINSIPNHPKKFIDKFLM